MHLSSTMRILTSALGLLSASSGLHAQAQAQVQTNAPDMPMQYATLLPAGGHIPFVPQVLPIKAAPFYASFQNESRQVLADGSTITDKCSGKVARDSEGRTYLEVTTTRGPAPNPQSHTSITVNDPVTGTHFTLNPAMHIAHRFQTPPRSANAAQMQPVAAGDISPETSGNIETG